MVELTQTSVSYSLQYTGEAGEKINGSATKSANQITLYMQTDNGVSLTMYYNINTKKREYNVAGVDVDNNIISTIDGIFEEVINLVGVSNDEAENDGAVDM